MHAQTVIIEPRKGKNEPGLPPLAILVFTPEDLISFLRCLKPQGRSRPRKVFLAHCHLGVYHDTRVAVVGPLLGAPQATMVLEKLIALGVRDVVAVGWCGSLQPHVRIGDLVLPLGAVSEEGTSRHYPTPEPHPSPSMRLLASLKEHYRHVPVALHEGQVWSTDAPFRETAAKVSSYGERNVVAVDMETSALLAVARFRDVRLAVVLIVSDELFTLKWRTGFRDERFLRMRAELPELTLGALCSKTRTVPPESE